MRYVLGLCTLAAVSAFAGKSPFFLEEKKPEPIPVVKVEDNRTMDRNVTTPMVLTPDPRTDRLNMKIQQGELPPLPLNSVLKEKVGDITKMFCSGIVSKKGSLVAIIENKEKQVGIFEKGQKMIVGDDVYLIKDIQYTGVHMSSDQNKTYFIPYGGKPSEGSN